MKIEISKLISEFETNPNGYFSKLDVLRVIKKLEREIEDRVVLKSNGLVVEVKEKIVHYAGEKILLTPNVFNLLVYLIERKNRLVTRDELLDNLWHNNYVNERIVDVQINTIRQTFGKGVVVTRKGYGYEWVEY